MGIRDVIASIRADLRAARVEYRSTREQLAAVTARVEVLERAAPGDLSAGLNELSMRLAALEAAAPSAPYELGAVSGAEASALLERAERAEAEAARLRLALEDLAEESEELRAQLATLRMRAAEIAGDRDLAREELRRERETGERLAYALEEERKKRRAIEKPKGKKDAAAAQATLPHVEAAAAAARREELKASAPSRSASRKLELTAAKSLPCPACDVGPGEQCYDFDDDDENKIMRAAPHGERFALARSVLTATSVECPKCGAAPGRPCDVAGRKGLHAERAEAAGVEVSS